MNNLPPSHDQAPLHHTTSPILIIFFNRVNTLEPLLDSILETKPQKVYLAQDGARHDIAGEKTKVLEARNYILNRVTWPCTIETNFLDKNLGCKKAVSQAINWFFENENEGIILEDDCVPLNNFYLFCDQLLEHYRDNPNVGMICGYNVSNHWFPKPTQDYYFSSFPLIWGWATWKRAWSNYDVEMRDFPKFRSQLMASLGNQKVKTYWDYLLKKTYIGRINTWDYQLNYHFLKHKLLCAIPQESLVQNIGFSEDATNTKSMPKYIETNTPKPFILNKVNTNVELTPNNERDNKFLLSSIDNEFTEKFSFIRKVCLELLYFLAKIRGSN